MPGALSATLSHRSRSRSAPSLSMPLLLVVSVLSSVAVAFSAQRRDIDLSYTIESSRFYTVAFHSSTHCILHADIMLTILGVLLGETLYQDGGDFTSTLSIDSDGNTHAFPLNSTYSLDLSSSWSPGEAVWNAIDKGECPILNRPNLWPAPDGKAYYSFNGDVPGRYVDQDPPSSPQLWRFTPGGLTSGSWELVGPASAAVHIQSQGAKVAFGNGSAHILGGYANWRSTQLYGSKDGESSADGMISYDMVTAAWQNRSMTDWAPGGWWLDGDLHFVSNLGGIGLVVAMGGITEHQDLSALVGETLISYERIGLFNPITGDWRNQTATGDIPTSRRRACSVAVPGDNGTYEVRQTFKELRTIPVADLQNSSSSTAVRYFLATTFSKLFKLPT